jgi:hypothetical protein
MIENYSYYLPEYYYIIHDDIIDHTRALRSTVMAALDLSIRCQLFDLTNPGERVDVLSESSLIDRKHRSLILSWLGSKTRSVFTSACNFWDPNCMIVNQYDGYPGHLCLTPYQYQHFQDMWVSTSLPDDLYYHSDLQVSREENVIIGQRTESMRVYYSPRLWQERIGHNT